MPSKKSWSNIFVLSLVAKRWNKFFYRTPKGTIDPDTEWRQQNVQQKKNKIYGMVNFTGQGKFLEEYNKGKNSEEKKKCVQDYFKDFVEKDYLCKNPELVTEDEYQIWHNKQNHIFKKIMHQKTKKDTLQSSDVYPNEVQDDGDKVKDDGNFSVVSFDSVIQPYKEHKIKWRLNERGAIGETPIHLLFLNGTETHIAVAKALLEKYPELAIDFYEGVEYYGETCLHLAIIQNNIKAVEIVLNSFQRFSESVEQDDILHARARGKFFAPVDINRGDVKLRKESFDGYAYYGEYPLSFAASIGNQKIYDLLIQNGSKPCKTDSFGNGVLHLAVIHNQPDMYYHAVNHPKNPADPDVCNNHDLSPLALAAKLGNTEMFDKILEISSKRYWSYNTVSCSAYPLKFLDSIGDKGQTNWNSALMMIVQGRKDSHLDMVSNQVVDHLLDEKWRIFGYWKFIRLLVAFIIHIVCLTVAVYLRPDQLADLRYGTSDMDIARYAFESLVVLISLIVLGLAAREIYLESLSGYWQNMVSIPSRAIYVIGIVLLLLCIPMRFLELYNIEEWFLVFAVPSLWSYSMFFLRISSHTGPLITIIFQIFRTDVIRFAIIYLIILLTSALAFDYQFEGEFFLSELGTIMGLFQMSYGEFDERVVLGGKYQALTIIMFVVFMIVVHILLLNMLIAMVTRTFENITQQSEKVWRRQRAAMIVTMERSHSKRTKLAFQEEYSVNIGSNRVTAEGDAEINNQRNKAECSSKNECFVNIESERALVVIHHQKLSLRQRKLNIKQQMAKIGLKLINSPSLISSTNETKCNNIVANARDSGKSSNLKKSSFSEQEN